MMKKISKLALLAAATAFLLAAFPACSGGDDGNETEQGETGGDDTTGGDENGGGDTTGGDTTGGDTTGGDTTGGDTTGGDTTGGDTTGGDKNDQENPPASATAKTYDFATLTAADVSALGITATETDSNGAKDTGKIAKKTDGEYTLSNGALLFSKGEGNLKIRFTEKGDINSAITSVNFGGQSIGDKDTTATPGEVGTTESAEPSRYIAVPVDASNFTVSVTYKSTNDKKIQIVVVDENGKILAKDEPNGAKAEKTYTTGTLEKGSASKIRIYLYRIDANNSGGADVSKIVVTPVNQ